MTDQPIEDLTARDDDWIPGVEDPPDLDDDEHGVDPDTAAIPIVDVDELPDANPAEQVDAQDDMDDSDLEGMGSADSQPIWRRAVPVIRDKCHTAAANQVAFCLREVRIPNETPSKYLDAISSLIAADVKHKVDDWAQVPRGSIGYFRGDPNTHPHGHVFENFGGAWIGTTDSPLGHWGRVSGPDLLARWGYEDAFWSPFVNDNRVWRPKRASEPTPPTPADRRLARYVAWRDELMRRHHTHLMDRRRAHVLEARITILTRLIDAMRERP